MMDKFITHQDSLRNFYAGVYSDTLINGVIVKKVSAYNHSYYDTTSLYKSEIPNYYYGKIEIKNGEVIGDSPELEFSFNDSIPYYIYTYRGDGSISEEGLYYKGQLYGNYVAYFRDGKICRTSQYISDTERKPRRHSGLQGETVFYTHAGEKTISEYYDNNKLTNIVPYNLNTNGAIHFLIDNRMLSINDTADIKDFSKLALFVDTVHNLILKKGIRIDICIWQGEIMDCFDIWNMTSFSDSNFISKLKKKKINLKKPMKMLVRFHESHEYEFIENHYLVFKN